MTLEVDSNACDLTEQELDVLQLLVAEKTDREIAHAINLSERHIRRILRRIYDKMGVNSRTGAAFQAGVLRLVSGTGQKLGRI